MSAKRPGQLTPTQDLVMEVLAARHRLGEVVWPFVRSTGVTRAIHALIAQGLVWTMNGQVERSIRVGLTEEGREWVLDTSYVSPAEKRWLKANPEQVRQVLEDIFR